MNKHVKKAIAGALAGVMAIGGPATVYEYAHCESVERLAQCEDPLDRDRHGAETSLTSMPDVRSTPRTSRDRLNAAPRLQT
jgi:hypothetical protein